MTIASGSQAKTAEQNVAESDANPTRNTEFDQVVVLVRLPYLPQQELSAPRCSERPVSVPSPVASSIDQRDSANTDSANDDQADGCLEPSSESVISKMRASVFRMFTEFNEKRPKKRLSPAAWNAAGLAVTVVLIFISLALLNGGVDSDVELASRASPASPSAERSNNEPNSLGTSPKLILAPKSDQVGNADKQPASLAEQESIPIKSEEDTSADRSAMESAVVDAQVDAQVDVEKKSPADPAEQEAEDSEVEEQVAEVEVAEVDVAEVEPPELEPMATVDESVAVQDSPAVSSSDEIPTPTEAASDQQATIFPAPSPEETASVSRAAPNQPTYPMTDPSTYQYPSHYEELLSNAANGIQDEGYPMSNPRASIYGWYPSTVRLQPRIEPPPIR